MKVKTFLNLFQNFLGAGLLVLYSWKGKGIQIF